MPFLLFLFSFLKKRIHKAVCVKLLQIIDLLSDTDIFNRYIHLGLDCDRNTASCSAV